MDAEKLFRILNALRDLFILINEYKVDILLLFVDLPIHYSA